MATTGQSHHCRHCGAVCEADEQVCWHCDAPADPAASGTTPSRRLGREGSHRSIGSFSLASLLLALTTVSLALGVAVAAPCIGVPLSLLLAIAWVRTAWAVGHLKQQGDAPTSGEMGGLYFRAVWTTVAIAGLLLLSIYVAVLAGGLWL